jgi:DNA-binding response OmpR family regulator
MTEQKHVLVVDDDPDTRNILGVVLGKRGLVVDFASEGDAALDLMRQRDYAVVMLDLMMPGKSGFTVLEELGQPGMPAPVVLVITGSSRSELDKLDPRRIHGVVKKPFDPEELASIVVACADIRSRSAFGTMAIAAMLAGGPLLDWLNRFRS